MISGILYECKRAHWTTWVSHVGIKLGSCLLSCLIQIHRSIRQRTLQSPGGCLQEVENCTSSTRFFLKFDFSFMLKVNFKKKIWYFALCNTATPYYPIHTLSSVHIGHLWEIINKRKFYKK